MPRDEIKHCETAPFNCGTHLHPCIGGAEHEPRTEHFGSCDGRRLTWGTEHVEAPAPVVLVSSRDEAPCPDVPAVELLMKRAVEAGWSAEKRYAFAAVPGIGRSSAHVRHSITVRLRREGQLSEPGVEFPEGPSTFVEAGYATFVRKDKAQGAGTDGVEYVEGTWGFEDAWVNGKPFGARQLPSRLTRPLGVLDPTPEIAEPDRPKRTTTQPAPPAAPPPVPNTWGSLHVGDKVRGMDGRDYYVTEALPAGGWIGSGMHEVRVVVRRADGTGDPLTYTQPAAAPVVITERGEIAQAVAVLTDAGMTATAVADPPATPIEETPVLDGTHDPLAEDPTGIDHAALCEHPAERVSKLTSGAIVCTACGHVLYSPPPAASTPAAEFAKPAPPQSRQYRSTQAKSADDDGTEHDRFGRYLLPDPVTGEPRAWTRASTMAKTLSDTYALTQWAKRMVAKGMALREDLVKLAASLDPDDADDKRKLDDVTEAAMERAGSTAGRNAGDALHRALKRTIRGQLLDLPESMQRDIDAAARECARHHFTITPELTERVVVNTELGVAGRFDLIVGQPAVRGNAPWAVADWKTNKTLDFSWDEYAIQLGIYARASHLWDPKTMTYLDLSTTPVDRDRAVLLHVPVGKGTATAYAIDLIDGWRKAQLALAVREERKNTAGHWLLEPDPSTLLLHLVTKAPDTGELQALMERGQREGSWSDEINRAAFARWEYLMAGVPA